MRPHECGLGRPRRVGWRRVQECEAAADEVLLGFGFGLGLGLGLGSGFGFGFGFGLGLGFGLRLGLGLGLEKPTGAKGGGE